MSNDILEEFIFDSRDHLTTAGTQLLALEKDPHSLANVNALMGTLHTIKGNSGFVNLKNLYNLLHAAESLLQTVREKNSLCPTSVVEELFQVLDTAEAIMDRLENGENDEVDWLPALNQALKETEDALEAAVALAETPSNEAYAPEPEPEPLAPSAPAPVVGQVVTLANGQLAEWGQAFLSGCQAALDGGQTTLALDLTNLSQFSSQEIGLLTELRELYGQGLGLVLVKERSPDFYRVFEVLDLATTFRLFPSVTVALDSLANPPLKA
ncbi:MAG: Hpt domain-containing protein [Deltaproteobacteria bacterium]|jgi:chemotaxis protein histidine kinase CheA|nr:Hpt domain-containing protein [Deltaproteobacteria bacterium]